MPGFSDLLWSIGIGIGTETGSKINIYSWVFSFLCNFSSGLVLDVFKVPGIFAGSLASSHINFCSRGDPRILVNIASFYCLLT